MLFFISKHSSQTADSHMTQGLNGVLQLLGNKRHFHSTQSCPVWSLTLCFESESAQLFLSTVCLIQTPRQSCVSSKEKGYEVGMREERCGLLKVVLCVSARCLGVDLSSPLLFLLLLLLFLLLLLVFYIHRRSSTFTSLHLNELSESGPGWELCGARWFGVVAQAGSGVFNLKMSLAAERREDKCRARLCPSELLQAGQNRSQPSKSSIKAITWPWPDCWRSF